MSNKAESKAQTFNPPALLLATSTPVDMEADATENNAITVKISARGRRLRVVQRGAAYVIEAAA